jgi:hypothetical protein
MWSLQRNDNKMRVSTTKPGLANNIDFGQRKLKKVIGCWFMIAA